MKKIHWFLLILAAAFVVLQLIPNPMPENTAAGTGDLLTVHQVPDEIAGMLKTSCYDCHSGETHFPWYSRIAPASWLLAKDIREGRAELNFSHWDTLSKRQQISKLEGIKEEVTDGMMPMPIYTLIHRKAKLNSTQVKALSKWTEDLTAKILE
jgi:hypothetical protein